MSDECGGKYQRWYQLERQLPSTNVKQEEQEHILYHEEKDNDLPTYEETQSNLKKSIKIVLQLYARRMNVLGRKKRSNIKSSNMSTSTRHQTWNRRQVCNRHQRGGRLWRCKKKIPKKILRSPKSNRQRYSNCDSD